MRPVEATDPRSQQLAELVDAGLGAKILLFHMGDGCRGVGRIYLVEGAFVVEMFASQIVATLTGPQRRRVRYVVAVDHLGDRPFDVGCQHVTERLDPAGVSRFLAEVKAGRLKVGASVVLPTASLYA